MKNEGEDDDGEDDDKMTGEDDDGESYLMVFQKTQ